MKTLTILSVLLTVSSCSIRRHDYSLPKFLYDKKPYNRLIVNRIPNYGDGTLDGCVVMGEMMLLLSPTNNNVVSGEIKDSKTLEPLPGAIIRIYFKNGKNPTKVSSDIQGKVEFIRRDKMDTIQINYVGYRTLRLNLSNNKKIL